MENVVYPKVFQEPWLEFVEIDVEDPRIERDRTIAAVGHTIETLSQFRDTPGYKFVKPVIGICKGISDCLRQLDDAELSDPAVASVIRTYLDVSRMLLRAGGEIAGDTANSNAMPLNP